MEPWIAEKVAKSQAAPGVTITEVAFERNIWKEGWKWCKEWPLFPLGLTEIAWLIQDVGEQGKLSGV